MSLTGTTIKRTTLSQFKGFCKELETDYNKSELIQLAIEMGLSQTQANNLTKRELCRKIATTLVIPPTIKIPFGANPKDVLEQLCNEFHNDVFLEETYKWAIKAGVKDVKSGMSKKELCALLTPVTVLTPDEQRKMTEQMEKEFAIKREAFRKVKETEEAARLKRIEENREQLRRFREFKEKQSKNVRPSVNIIESQTKLIPQSGQRATSIMVRPPVRKSMSERERINYLCKVLGNESLEDLKKIAKSKGLQDAEGMDKAMICKYLAKETYLEWLPKDIKNIVELYKQPSTIDEYYQLAKEHYSPRIANILKENYPNTTFSADYASSYTYILPNERYTNIYTIQGAIGDYPIMGSHLDRHGIPYRNIRTSRFGTPSLLLDYLKEYIFKGANIKDTEIIAPDTLKINYIQTIYPSFTPENKYIVVTYSFVFKLLPTHPHLPIVWEFTFSKKTEIQDEPADDRPEYLKTIRKRRY